MLRPRLSGEKEENMNTKRITILVVSLITASFHIAGAQQRKIPVIGYLSGGSASVAAPRVDAFRQGLRELGYIEGQNIGVEYRYADGNVDRVSDQIGELVRLKVDVVVSGNEASIRAAQQATKTVPIITAATGDPVGSGFVASLARPGGNITGTTSLGSETLRKRVELLKEAVPQLTHLAVLWNPGNVTKSNGSKKLTPPPKLWNSNFNWWSCRGRRIWTTPYQLLPKNGRNGLYIFRSPVVTIHTKVITEFAAKNRIATMHEDNRFVEGGGLMSYGPDLLDLDRRTAVYVDKI
jgi:putative tryptophan/tyrosine transport system substrate-binding protein